VRVKEIEKRERNVSGPRYRKKNNISSSSISVFVFSFMAHASRQVVFSEIYIYIHHIPVCNVFVIRLAAMFYG